LRPTGAENVRLGIAVALRWAAARDREIRSANAPHGGNSNFLSARLFTD